MDIVFKISPRCLTPNRERLFITVTDQGAVVARIDLGSDPAQLWKRVLCQAQNRAYIVNVKTGTCLHVVDADKNVGLAPVPNEPSNYSLWNFGGNAIQSARCENWNLNVRGNSWPDGTVIYVRHGWSSDPNECWDWLPFHAPVIDPTKYKISPRCKTPEGAQLFMTRTPDNRVVAKRDLGMDPCQLWQRAPCFGVDHSEYIVNVESGTCLHVVDANENVGLIALPCAPDDYSLWNFGSNAIQSAHCENWNLNVRGDSWPDGTAVYVRHGWSRDQNECWDWIEVGAPQGPNIQLLSYNTHLFKGHLAELPQKLGFSDAKTVCYRDDERAQAIAERILAGNFDVVCLQEVWGAEMRDWFQEKLSNVFPFSSNIPGSIITDSDIEDIIEAYCHSWGDLKQNLLRDAIRLARTRLPKFTNGLMVFSKYSLMDVHYEPSQGLRNPEDRLGKKGLLRFCVQFLGQDGTVKSVQMGTIHGPTDVMTDGVDTISNTAKEMFGISGGDVVFMGDFNFHHYHADERDALQSIMSPLGAVDIIGCKWPNAEDCFTDWPYDNTLHWAIDGRPEKDGGKERIDYFFYRPAKNPASAVLANPLPVVPKDWKIIDPQYGYLDLSDHNPITSVWGLS